MSEVRVHPQSEAGYAAGEEYDRARPRYPDESLAYIKDALGGKTGLRIVEVGCGTGLFTKSLLANPDWNSSISELRCVEPVVGMLEALRATVRDDRVSTYRGTFDKTGIQDSGFADLVVAATAYHWCLDLEASIAEFVRLLTKDGVLCFLWNMEDRQTATWLERFMQVVKANLPRDIAPTGAPDLNHWRVIFDMPIYKENFDPPTEHIIRYVTPSTFDSIWARCRTWSQVGAMPEDLKQNMREELRKIIDSAEDVVYSDKAKGLIDVPSVVPITIMKRMTKS